jgi:hypothetical protein
MTEHDQDVLAMAMEQERQMKNQASFLKVSDSNLGPGHYNPNQDFVMKKNPTVSISNAAVKQPAYKGLENLVDDSGNLAHRVNKAQNKIKEYLGDNASLLRGNSKRSLNTLKSERFKRNSIGVDPGIGQANFLSGVKRTDFT